MPNLLLSALLIPLAACSMSFGGDDGDGRGEDRGTAVAASGTGTSRSFDATGFTGVSLAGSDDVDVRVGPAFSVRAEGPADVLDRLRIERDGDALRIGRKRGMSSVRGQARVFVTLPRLAKVGLAGSGDMRVDRVEGEAFNAALAGSGNLTLGRLAVRSAGLKLAGSGDLSAAGRAERLDVSVAGSGNVEAAGLAAAGAEVSVAGSGDVRAAVDGPAKVSLMGSGDVDLGPRAQCSVAKMGSGSVRCGSGGR